jgi:hypothetical protein
MRLLTVLGMLFLKSFLGLGQQQLLVDNATVIQPKFLGVNVVHNGFTYMPQSQTGRIQVSQNPLQYEYHPMTDQARATLLKRLKETGVTLVRTSFQPWFACGQSWDGQYNWNSEYMEAFCLWLADMQANNIEVALSLGHYFPGDVYYWNYEGHKTENIAKKYAHWASEALHQLIEVKGFTHIKYAFLFTEPQATPTQDFQYAKGSNNWDLYKNVCLEIDKKLKADGRRNLVELVGPNNFPKYDQSPDLWLGKAVAELNNVFDIYAGHHYHQETYQAWTQLCQEIKKPIDKTQKPFWIDEFGGWEHEQGHVAYGQKLTVAIHAFMNAGAQSCFLWQFSEDIYPSANPAWGTEGFSLPWGLLPNVAKDTTPKPAFYSFALIGQFFNSKNEQILATKSAEKVLISAVKNDSNELSVLVSNTSEISQNISLNFSKKLGQRKLFRYTYNPAKSAELSLESLLQSDKTFEKVDKALIDNIPQGSIIVYSTIQKKLN